MIIQLLLIYLSICSISFFLTFCKNKTFTVGLPLSSLIFISILYIFSIINMLRIGLYIVYFLIILCYILGIYNFCKAKEKKELLKKFFEGNFYVFTIVFIIICLLCIKNKVINWDELRLWGAFPKILFYKNRLPQFANSPMFDAMKGYQPGMPLLQYMFLKFNIKYVESILHITYYSFCASLIVSIYKSNKRVYNNIIYIMLTLIIPYLFYNISSTEEAIAYYDLFIDCSLGVLFGYLLIKIFDFKNKSNYILVSLGIFVITIFKTTGLIFGGLAYLTFLFNYYLNNKKILNYTKKDIKKILIPGIVLIFAFLSWKVFLHFNSVKLVTKIENYSFLSNITNNLPAYTKETLNMLYKKIFIIPSVSGIFSPFIFLCFFIVNTIIIVKNTKNERKKIISFSTAILIFFVIYVGTLTYAYLFGFKEWEAVTLASFRRYLNSYLIGIMMYLIYLISYYIDFYKKNNSIYLMKMTIIVFCSMSLIFLPLESFKNIITTKRINSDNYIYNACVQYTNKYKENIEKVKTAANKKIYFMIDETKFDNLTCEKTLIHHKLYYDLIDKNYFIANFETMNIELENNKMTKIKQYNYWSNILKNYDYLYISNPITKDYEKTFKLVFDYEGKIENNILYKIEFVDAKLLLISN